MRVVLRKGSRPILDHRNLPCGAFSGTWDTSAVPRFKEPLRNQHQLTLGTGGMGRRNGLLPPEQPAPAVAAPRPQRSYSASFSDRSAAKRIRLLRSEFGGKDYQISVRNSDRRILIPRRRAGLLPYSLAYFRKRTMSPQKLKES